MALHVAAFPKVLNRTVSDPLLKSRVNIDLQRQESPANLSSSTRQIGRQYFHARASTMSSTSDVNHHHVDVG